MTTHPIIMMLNKAVLTTRLKRGVIIYAMQLAIEEAVCDYFKIRDCEANLRYQTVYPVFHFPESMVMKDAELFDPGVVFNDSIYPEFLFETLHEDIILRCRELFARNLRIIQEQNMHKEWKKMKHRVVSGYIVTVDANKITIDLGEEGVCGIMYKSEWVPAEIPMYKKEKFLKFYVVKVIRNKSQVVIYLSRGTPSFPIALIREQVHGPATKTIKMIRRLRGRKSWIESSEPIPPSVLEEVKKELRGERLDIVVKNVETKRGKTFLICTSSYLI